MADGVKWAGGSCGGLGEDDGIIRQVRLRGSGGGRFGRVVGIVKPQAHDVAPWGGNWRQQFDRRQWQRLLGHGYHRLGLGQALGA